MRVVFADTSYWVAVMDPRDQWHDQAVAIGKSLENDLLLTTDEVLIELLAFFSAFDPRMRQYLAEFVRDLLANQTHVDVVEQSRESFLAGLALYEKRPDKSYSLVDCISMQLMKAEGLTDALTSDGHFFQEGFTILLKEHMS
ncbi:MAG: PIN domain-containing protein [Acidobacteriota bacterium]